MSRSVSVLLTVVIVAGIVQLVLGSLFWAGTGTNLIPVHEAIGTILVLSLWALAFLAARAGVSRGLAVLAAVWGVVVPVIGIAQTNILAGSAHGLIQVVHLALGLGAMVFACAL